MKGARLLVLVAVLAVPGVSAGNVVSVLRARGAVSARGAPADGDERSEDFARAVMKVRRAARARPSPATQAPPARPGGRPILRPSCFGQLRDAPHSEEALEALLGYIERMCDSPGEARRLCLWEPKVRALLDESPAALECLLKAGYVERVDARGTPFLVMRRPVNRQALRTLAGICHRELQQARAAGGNGRGQAGAEASAPSRPKSTRDEQRPRGRSGARKARTAATSSRRDGRGAAEAGNGDAEDEARSAPSEKQLIEQIQEMVSGLISELEQQGAPRNGTDPVADADQGDGDGMSRNEQGSSKAPVYFRVYRGGPGFPGLPPGMGMPFMPGGGGGDDEDGEVPALERRLHAANLPTEAEEVSSSVSNGRVVLPSAADGDAAPSGRQPRDQASEADVPDELRILYPHRLPRLAGRAAVERLID